MQRVEREIHTVPKSTAILLTRTNPVSPLTAILSFGEMMSRSGTAGSSRCPGALDAVSQTMALVDMAPIRHFFAFVERGATELQSSSLVFFRTILCETS